MKAIQWFPGHMAKGKRLINEYKKVIDLYLIVVDARIPLSGIHDAFSRDNIDYDKVILVMSKDDLADKKITDKWEEHYKNVFHDVVRLNVRDNKKAETKILSVMNRYFDQKQILRKQVMVLGVPNVGKSTLINSLSHKKLAKVENRPGLTRGVSFVNGKDGIRYFDTPGILEPKVETDRDAYYLAMTNAIKKDILDKADIVEYAYSFVQKYYFNQFAKYYGIEDKVDSSSELWEVEEAICRKKGFILKGNEFDYERLFDSILISISDGKICPMSFDRK